MLCKTNLEIVHAETTKPTNYIFISQPPLPVLLRDSACNFMSTVVVINLFPLDREQERERRDTVHATITTEPIQFTIQSKLASSTWLRKSPRSNNCCQCFHLAQDLLSDYKSGLNDNSECVFVRALSPDAPRRVVPALYLAQHFT